MISNDYNEIDLSQLRAALFPFGSWQMKNYFIKKSFLFFLIILSNPKNHGSVLRFDLNLYATWQIQLTQCINSTA